MPTKNGGEWQIPEEPVYPLEAKNQFQVCYLCGGPAVTEVKGGNPVCGQHQSLLAEVEERLRAQHAAWTAEEAESAPHPPVSG